MNELKTIDKIIEVSELETKKEILNMCLMNKSYNTYDNFFDAVNKYEDAGFRIKYLFNINTQEYYFEPIEKVIGFRK